MSGDVLIIEGLTAARGSRTVVHEVSLEIPGGTVTTLLGPNGAGKSTAVLAIGGVLKPVAGRILLDGRNLAGRRPEQIRRAGIAIVPEGRRLLRDLTVAENLRLATYTLPAADAQAELERALELFGPLQARLSHPGRALSGGEQQMVVLAQALMSRPRYIVIDELSLGLAPVIVDRLVAAIRQIADHGIGVLLIDQFATIALELATHAYVLGGGRIRYSGAAAELRRDPGLLHSAYLLRGITDP
jgi:branched-chain amino acid transport system ATP-binding protein